MASKPAVRKVALLCQHKDLEVAHLSIQQRLDPQSSGRPLVGMVCGTALGEDVCCICPAAEGPNIGTRALDGSWRY